MSEEQGNEHQLSSSSHLTKDQQKKIALSIKTAHILSLLSRSKFLQTGDHFPKGIEHCLELLDAINEISLVLKALKFSDHVAIIFDFKKTNLETVAKSDALGWFSDEEKELLLGAKEIFSDRAYFLGVFAHELTHWCMVTVFKNEGRPYYSSDPKRVREKEFKDLVKVIRHEIETEGKSFDCIIESVFEYNKSQWDKELIVRVPHMIAAYGLDDGVKILSRNESTRHLLNYYRTFVMTETERFIANGDLAGSRESVARLNRNLMLLELYQEFDFHFNDEPPNFSESTSLLVYSSSHPYLSFMKIAWTLNCLQPNNGFYETNVFCDLDAFEGKVGEINRTFHKLDVCKTLFLVCAQVDSEAYRNLFSWLEDIVSTPGKKVILIIANMLRRATERKLNTMSGITSSCTVMKKMEITDLAASSQATVLKQPITILGEPVTLGDVIDEGELHLADGNFIERLLKKEEIAVGEKADSAYDRPPGFVSFDEKMTVQRVADLIGERPLADLDYFLIIVGDSENYAKPIEEELCAMFNVASIDELFVSSADEIDICETHHIALLSPGTKLLYSEYSRIVNSLIESEFDACYFINIESKEIVHCDSMYMQSIAFNRILQLKYSSIERETQIDVEDVTKMLERGDHRVVVLSDEAGSGKSLFLNSIYHSIAGRWVVKVSLKSCISFIDRHSLRRDLNKEQAITFLCALGRIEDKFVKDLFSSKMQNESKLPIILMLDGFDEMTSSDKNSASKNKEKIANLLMFLSRSTRVTTIVTTRPESESYLSNLSSPVYEFTSITEDDRLEFIEYFCLSKIELFSESESTAEFVKNSKDHLRKGLRSVVTSNDFFETPLHVRMFADIYLESHRTLGSESTAFFSYGDFRIDLLYSEFIKMKYRIYFKEKNKNQVDDRSKEASESAFSKLALFSLYGNEEFCKHYFSNDTLFIRDAHGHFSLNCETVGRYYDIGIISSSTSSTVTFVHRTFAEYFVSNIFISWSQDNLLYEKVILEVVYQPGKTIAQFYEYLLLSVLYSEDLLKAHGNFMVGLDIHETMDMLFDHLKSGHLNIVDYVLKCWRLAGKSRLLFNRETWGEHRFLRLPRFLDAIMAGHGFPYGFDYEYEREAYHKIDTSERDSSSVSEEEEDLFLCLRLFEKGKLEIFKNIVQDETIDRHRSHLILLAAASGNVEAVSWLEGSGCDIHARTATGASAVTLAIRKGKLEMAKWLNERGVCIEWRTSYGGSLAIHDAVIANQFPAIQWLILQGSSINSTDHQGLTPLHLTLKCYGFYKELFEKVKCLCELGADVHARSEGGMGTLHHAGGVVDPKVVEWLVAQGCKFDDRTDDGRSALHTAFLPDGIIFSIKKFLDRHTASNRDLIENSLLREGGSYTDDDLSLILKNVDVNLRDKGGLTAAHIALNTLPLAGRGASDPIYCRLLVNFKRVVKMMAESNPEITKELSLHARSIMSRNESFCGALEPVVEWLDTPELHFHNYESYIDEFDE